MEYHIIFGPHHGSWLYRTSFCQGLGVLYLLYQLINVVCDMSRHCYILLYGSNIVDFGVVDLLRYSIPFLHKAWGFVENTSKTPCPYGLVVRCAWASSNTMVMNSQLYYTPDTKVHVSPRLCYTPDNKVHLGPRWAPCWPHEPCYCGQGNTVSCNQPTAGNASRYSHMLVNIVAADALVLKHQVIDIHSNVSMPIVPHGFIT